jgi:hypothetical protein
VSAWEHNHRAIAFYAKHGCVQVGAIQFTLGSDVQIDLVMVRPLRAGRSATPSTAVTCDS